MQIGDLVMTHRGNLAVITGVESCGIYVNLLFCNTGHHRTGFHVSGILRKVQSEK